jgi:excisionase family DNA binding protein
MSEPITVTDVSEHSVSIHGGGPRRTEWTVKEYAIVEGVTERTVWTWIAKGAITVRRTPGGHIRIPRGG